MGRRLPHMTDEQKTERVQLMMTPSEVKAIDDYSFAGRIRGRSETIRRLVQIGLKASKKDAAHGRDDEQRP